MARETASWFYVFGSAAFVVFFLQIVTGIMLALVYVPSAGEAWSSLEILNHSVGLGWFIRVLHRWGSDFMVAIVLIHMVSDRRIQVPSGADLDRLHGLHAQVVRRALDPLLRWKPAQRAGRFLAHPVTCWLTAMIALLAWHVPAAFDLALGSDLGTRSNTCASF